jgi:hypothetical protein
MKDGNARTNVSKESPAKRKRKERARMRDLGFKVMQFYVHKKEVKNVRHNMSRLQAKHMPKEG